MNVQIEESWRLRLQPEFDKEYFRTLTDFVREEYRKGTVYPPGRLIFNAFNLCPFDRVKVVIIGQDPYHGPGQAHGVSRTGTGPRALLLRERRGGFPSFSTEYIQGNKE